MRAARRRPTRCGAGRSPCPPIATSAAVEGSTTSSRRWVRSVCTCRGEWRFGAAALFTCSKRTACSRSGSIHACLQTFEELLGLDVGMIGASAHGGERIAGTEWVVRPEMAFETHCVILSSQARERIRAHVSAHPASVQVDAMLCELAIVEQLRLAVCVDKRVAWQSHNASAIQLPAAAVRQPPDLIIPTRTSHSSDATSAGVMQALMVGLIVSILCATAYLIVSRRAA
jgi:hypothetical protein